MPKRLEALREEIAKAFQKFFSELREQAAETIHAVSEGLADQILHRQDALDFGGLRCLQIPVADVEQNCEQLQAQIAASRDIGSELPCSEIGDQFVPVAIPGVPLHESPFRDPSLQRQWLREQFESLIPPTNATVKHLSSEEATDGFSRALIPFLADRLAASTYFPLMGITGGMNSAPLMLTVQVSSPTSGARVSYSPSYFVNYRVLSSPTSPVVGQILPGRYIFMLTTTSQQRLYDKGTFDIPPLFVIPLTV